MHAWTLIWRDWFACRRIACFILCRTPSHTHTPPPTCAHKHRSFSLLPMADGTARTTMKYGFTSCFHRQAANYLLSPGSRVLWGSSKSQHPSHFSQPACRVLSSPAAALLAAKPRRVWAEACACMCLIGSDCLPSACLVVIELQSEETFGSLSLSLAVETRGTLPALDREHFLQRGSGCACLATCTLTWQLLMPNTLFRPDATPSAGVWQNHGASSLSIAAFKNKCMRTWKLTSLST